MEQDQTPEGATQETPEQPAKKNGKLPLVIILALVLAAGGFFAMKLKKGKAGKPEVKLGKIAKIEEEFLVPLMGDGTYLRTNISLHLAEGYDEKALTEEIDAVRDTIIMRLKSKWIKELQTLDDIRELKRELAKDVNGVITGKPEQQEASVPKNRSKPPAREHPYWDSDAGPVLKVYFTTFATQ